MVRLENVSTIKNKLKRREVWSKVKADKKKAKKQARKLRDKEVEELGEEARVKQVGPPLDGCRSRKWSTAPQRGCPSQTDLVFGMRGCVFHVYDWHTFRCNFLDLNTTSR